MDELIYEAYKESLQYGQCGMLTGRETIEELCRMIFTAQGIEYMTTHSFPSLALVRRMAKKYDLTKYHVYVDKGKLTFQNERRVCLMGNTQAEILCDQTKACHIHLLHGARAIIHAKGYTVTCIEKDALSDVSCDATEHAKIMM